MQACRYIRSRHRRKHTAAEKSLWQRFRTSSSPKCQAGCAWCAFILLIILSGLCCRIQFHQLLCTCSIPKSCAWRRAATPLIYLMTFSQHQATGIATHAIPARCLDSLLQSADFLNISVFAQTVGQEWAGSQNSCCFNSSRRWISLSRQPIYLTLPEGGYPGSKLRHHNAQAPTATVKLLRALILRSTVQSTSITAGYRAFSLVLKGECTFIWLPAVKLVSANRLCHIISSNLRCPGYDLGLLRRYSIVWIQWALLYLTDGKCCTRTLLTHRPACNTSN